MNDFSLSFASFIISALIPTVVMIKNCLLQKPEVMRVKSWQSSAHFSSERCDSLLLAQISILREVVRIPELVYDILPIQELDLH